MKHILTSILFLLFTATASILIGKVNENHNDTVKLVVGMAVNKEMKLAEIHKYRIYIKSNHFLYGYVNQKGLDVVVKIFDPNGKKVDEINRPHSDSDPENILLYSKHSGDYVIEIHPSGKLPVGGKYTIKMKSTKKAAKTIEGKINQLLVPWKNKNSPGAIIAVVRGGKIIYKKGFGLANLEYDIPITPSTIFNSASVSKQFTAFAVALLAQQGKISLDDDIRNYIPEIPDFDTTITIKHLIHHTSGLRDDQTLMRMAGWREDDVVTRSQMLKHSIHQKALNFAPGDEWRYSNSNYTLLAEIVERVTSQSIAEWTRANIFEPMEMLNTQFYDDQQKIIKNRAYSYTETDEQSFKNKVLSYANTGSTNLYTSIEDLAKWAVNFDQPKSGFGSIIKQMEEQAVLTNGDTNFYAFGQAVVPYKGLQRIYHDGSQAGYRSSLMRFPEQKFAVIILSNLASFTPTILAEKITDIYLAELIDKYALDEKPGPHHSESEQEIPPTLNPEQLSEFEGDYYSDELGTIYTFNVKGEQLVAEHRRQQDIVFFPRGKDHFSSEIWYFKDIHFVRDDQNQITGCKDSTSRVENVHFSKTNTNLN